MMQVIESLEQCESRVSRDGRGLVLTIGSFDGVHRGHQHLIAGLIVRAQELGSRAGALTFHPHPRAVLRPEQPLNYLSSLDERRDLLASLGLDLLIVVPFDRELAATSASDLLGRLDACLDLRELWVGADFCMGRDRAGSSDRLAEIGQQLQFDVHVVEPYHDHDQPISSTRIRRLLAEGNVSSAMELLGRPYALRGPVVHGFQRGREIGFPTANVSVPGARAMPAHGIYAVCCEWEDRKWLGVANVGTRPTFDNGHVTLEVHLIDFEGDLYGVEMRVEFVAFQRPEVRFESVDELIVQIEQDVIEAREILGIGVCDEG